MIKIDYSGILKEFGYIYLGGAIYEKNLRNCSAIVTLRNNGIHLKVYGFGYAESDFISNIGLDENKLRSFLRANSI
jgi:hypothetical protein